MGPTADGKTGTKTMFHVTIHVKPSDVDEFLTVLRSIHHDVTSEKECLFVDLYQNPEDPGLFRITEAWAADLRWFVDVCGIAQAFDAFIQVLNCPIMNEWLTNVSSTT
jgi:hypothetical protein